MQKTYLNLPTQKFKHQTAIHFDANRFKPTPESIKIYDELNKISEEIEKCRKRNSNF